ncbi:hypothetical protein [Methanobrevibacter sp.]|uniref:hypothetical protein n=1 Tax=Methanobrevibacter sp. TaxID=66852 RepID=UPI0038682C3A
MKFKKSMFILILAVFLISIAGVCASDVNDMAVASQEDAVTELVDENPITVEDNEPALTAADEEILSDSVADESVGAENDLDELSATQSTYSGLSSEIGSGGNIKLNYDYYTYDEGDTIEITTDDSVIDGNGAIIDMAGSLIQAFSVTASNVTIKNLNIINANAEKSGAAIFFNKTGFVENCNFTNNTASGTYSGGGAICFNATSNVMNCNFVNNTVSSLINGGGAIYFINGAGNVINCNFTKRCFW